jgi:hypothetical protein
LHLQSDSSSLPICEMVFGGHDKHASDPELGLKVPSSHQVHGPPGGPVVPGEQGGGGGEKEGGGGAGGDDGSLTHRSYMSKYPTLQHDTPRQLQACRHVNHACVRACVCLQVRASKGDVCALLMKLTGKSFHRQHPTTPHTSHLLTPAPSPSRPHPRHHPDSPSASGVRA